LSKIAPKSLALGRTRTQLCGITYFHCGSRRDSDVGDNDARTAQMGGKGHLDAPTDPAPIRCWRTATPTPTNRKATHLKVLRWWKRRWHLSPYLPDVHDWLVLVREQLQNIQKVVAPIIGNRPNPIPSLDADAESFRFDSRGIEEKLRVYRQ